MQPVHQLGKEYSPPTVRECSAMFSFLPLYHGLLCFAMHFSPLAVPPFIFRTIVCITYSSTLNVQ
uniref:Uncharacterized protein n=1 Tax=Siphoviridae sp. ctg8V11 TaxID=2827910 RepID=A0A8S5T3M0_9CAUD|nr:MAG TPA: hypothetical protein [Siphoviridae sp. ctg8V11]